MQRKLFELAVGLVPLGALSKALGPILRAVVGAAERSTVWSKVIATSGNWAGTSVPHTFVLVADNGSEYWVNTNGSKHIAQYVTGQGTREPLNTQVQLYSLQQAVSQASRQGIRLGEAIVVGGWELKFSQSAGDELPVLIHALYVG